ncbi:MAG: helix-turn-helix domain-containing protein [Pseudomonadota bacterium]
MDAIFKALNDPARRALLDSLRAKDGQSLMELEEQLDMTRFGVMKHLKVLEDANLIVPRKVGRFKYHYLNALPLQEVIDRWVEPLLARPAARAMADLKTELENPMSKKPDFVMQTFIRCTQDALWDALTKPEGMANYHFMANRIELQDNKLVYYTPDDNIMLICTHTEETPKTRIESTFEPHWAGPDVPLDKSSFVYLIEPEGTQCKLTLEHYDIPAGQEGVADGWARMMSGLKTWLETGEPAKFGSAA